MNKFLADIVAFHEKFHQAYDGPPRPLPPDLMEFRGVAMNEELDEMAVANAEGDMEELLDAFVDHLYFVLGTVYLAGMFPIFEEAWDRVQAANMSKVVASSDNPSKRGFNRFDIVKPEGWQPPRHQDLIDRITP